MPRARIARPISRRKGRRARYRARAVHPRAGRAARRTSLNAPGLNWAAYVIRMSGAALDASRSGAALLRAVSAAVMLRIENAVLAAAAGLGELTSLTARGLDDLACRLQAASTVLAGKVRVPRVPSGMWASVAVGLMLAIAATVAYRTIEHGLSDVPDPDVAALGDPGLPPAALQANPELEVADAEPPGLAEPPPEYPEPGELAAVAAEPAGPSVDLAAPEPNGPPEPGLYALAADWPVIPEPRAEVPAVPRPKPDLPVDADALAGLHWYGGPEEGTAIVTAPGEVQPPLEPEVAAIRPAIPEPPPAGPSVTPPWLANAVQSNPYDSGRPMIAIVIDDVGVAQERSRAIVELPPPLTMAVIPYGNNLGPLVRRLRERGHELLVHIPMEPTSADADPGPNALLTGLGNAEVMRRLRWGLGRMDGYVGVSNHMGSLFMEREDMVRPVLALLRERGLMFLDSRTTAGSVGAPMARDMGVPTASRDVFLDNELTHQAIRAQLDRLERVARRQGYAVGLGHPHDATREVLADWLPQARRRGIALVPITAIVKRLQESDPVARLAKRG